MASPPGPQAPPTTALPARAEALECPGCRRAVPGSPAVCPFCWAPLTRAVGLDASAVAQRQARARERSADERRVRIIRLVLATALAAFVVWRWQLGPDDLPRPISAVRGVIAASAQPAQWPIDGGDAGRTGATAATPMLDAPIAWRADLGSRATTPLVAGEGAVYVGVEGALVALSAADGRELWRTAIVGQFDSAPTLAGDRLYASLRNGRLAAYDARDGRELWTAGEGAMSPSSPLVAGGVVYGVSSAEDVRGFDGETGAVLWDYSPEVSMAGDVNPALGPDHLVMAAPDRVVVYERSSGKELSFYTIPLPANVLVSGRTVVATGRNRVAAFGLDQRRPWWEPTRMLWGQFWFLGIAPKVPPQPQHWAVEAPRAVLPPAIAGDLVVIATAAGEVSALALETGEERWKFRAGALAARPVATAGGVLLVERGALVLLDAATGADRARRTFEGQSLGGVAVTAHGTYVLSDGTKVAALRR